MTISQLKEKIDSREVLVGVVGLGYVGLPLAIAYNDAGYKVIGFDISTSRVDETNAGRSVIEDVPSERLKVSTTSGMIVATTDMSRLAEPDIIVICVPTPLTPHREPDMSYVESTAETLLPYLRTGQLIVLESTVYPGATRESLLPILERDGLREGKDFLLAFSPERVDPGNKKYSIADIPKVIGGISKMATEIACEFYRPVVSSIVPVSSPEAAEMSKLLENTYRAVNIALVNELKVLCHSMDLDIFEIIDAAATKPYGYQVFYPGPGVGGHCIPLDPFYLAWKAREYEYVMHFVERAGEINWMMPPYVVKRLVDALNDRGKTVNGAKILVMGVAYKGDVNDMRESPALPVIELLGEYGAKLDYFDPYIPEMPETRKFRFALKSIEFTEDNLKGYDAAIIVTQHSNVDYQLLFDTVPLVIDTRGMARKVGYTGDNVVNG